MPMTLRCLEYPKSTRSWMSAFRGCLGANIPYCLLSPCTNREAERRFMIAQTVRIK